MLMSRPLSSSTVGPKAQLANPAVIWLLAIGSGVGVASVYYSQPVLPLTHLPAIMS
jgi:hypothetical protein